MTIDLKFNVNDIRDDERIILKQVYRKGLEGGYP